jgi:hypothetical protein
VHRLDSHAAGHGSPGIRPAARGWTGLIRPGGRGGGRCLQGLGPRASRLTQIPAPRPGCPAASAWRLTSCLNRRAVYFLRSSRKHVCAQVAEGPRSGSGRCRTRYGYEQREGVIPIRPGQIVLGAGMVSQWTPQNLQTSGTLMSPMPVIRSFSGDRSGANKWREKSSLKSINVAPGDVE